MKPSGKAVAFTVAGLVCAGQAPALLGDTGENPYRIIVERNAFNLKQPPPAPPPPEVKPPTPPLNVKLTGISRIDDVTRAHLMVEDPKLPGQPQYLSLADDPDKDNTTHGGIQVLKIDQAKEIVRIKNGLSEVTLNFKDNGNTAKGAPVPVVPHGVPPPPGAPRTAGAPVTSAGAPVIVSSRNPAGSTAMPPNPRITVSSASGNPGAAPVTDVTRSYNMTSSLRTIPTRTMRTSPLQPGTTAQFNSDRLSVVTQPAQPALSAEQQIILMEANRVHAEGQGIPMPPTPGLPETTVPLPPVPAPTP